MTANDQPTPMPDGTTRPAPPFSSPSCEELERAPAHLAGLAERLFSRTLSQLRALQREDPLLARDVAGRWADTLDALAQH